MKFINDYSLLEKKISEYKKSAKKIVLAHGTFDLLHIGHIKHLDFAKKFGQILIVTITADKFVKKGIGRPFFKENFRSEMLKSLKIVDDVFIINHASALPAIKAIKPDFYLKGEEYKDNSKDITKKINLEKKEVKKSGGKIIYSGAITFSSSNLLNNYFSDLPIELKKKLHTFKKKRTLDKIISHLGKIRNKKILLVGESILDEYRYVEPLGKTPKENLISNLFKNNEVFAGGVLAAGIHLSSFSNNIQILTSFKNDLLNKVLKNFKTKLKIKNLKLNTLDTIQKIRYVEKDLNRKLFQIYQMQEKLITNSEENKILNYLKKNISKYDLVIINDFGHNFFTKKIIHFLESKSKFLAINAQSNSANHGFNLITKYKKADYVCIDYPEAKLASQNKHDGAEKSYNNILSKKIKTEKFAITLGKDGSIIFDKKNHFRLPAFSNRVLDTMGAGDAFFVVTSLFASCGFKLDELTLIGNAIGSLKTNIRGHSKRIDLESFLTYINTILK